MQSIIYYFGGEYIYTYTTEDTSSRNKIFISGTCMHIFGLVASEYAGKSCNIG